MIHLGPEEQYEMLHQIMIQQALLGLQDTEAEESMMLQPVQEPKRYQKYPKWRYRNPSTFAAQQ